MSNSLRLHGLQHARPPYPTPTIGVYSNSCPLSQWCHPTVSSSVVPCSSCLQSFPASGSFLMSQFFVSGGQSIGVSASASVLPTNIQDWFPLGWTGWISLLSKGLSRVLSNTTVYGVGVNPIAPRVMCTVDISQVPVPLDCAPRGEGRLVLRLWISSTKHSPCLSSELTWMSERVALVAWDCPTLCINQVFLHLPSLPYNPNPSPFLSPLNSFFDTPFSVFSFYYLVEKKWD